MSWRKVKVDDLGPCVGKWIDFVHYAGWDEGWPCSGYLLGIDWPNSDVHYTYLYLNDEPELPEGYDSPSELGGYGMWGDELVDVRY